MTGTPAGTEIALGTHLIRIVDDLIEVTVRGVFTLADMQRFVQLADAHGQKYGYALVLTDIDAAKGLQAEARRFAADHNRAVVRQYGEVHSANAIFGGSVLMRGMGALFLAVIRLVSSSSAGTHLAGSEAEARAFLAEQRRRFREKLGLDR